MIVPVQNLAGVKPLDLSRLTPAVFYDTCLNDSCIFSSELAELLFKLKAPSSSTNNIDLYVLEEPLKISLQTKYSFKHLERECARIGVHPVQYRREKDIWISEKGSEVILLESRYTLAGNFADARPVYEKSISVNFFRAHQRLFDAFYGPGSTLHVTISLCNRLPVLSHLTESETKTMFDLAMKHRHELTTDFMSIAFSVVTYLAWGVLLGKTPSDCKLDTLDIFSLFKYLLEKESWIDFICLASRPVLWQILDSNCVAFLKTALAGVMHQRFELASLVVETLYIEEDAIPPKTILASLVKMMNNPLFVKHHMNTFYYLTETYAEMVHHRFDPEDKKEIGRVLREIFFLPSRCDCRHIRKYWDFAFTDDDETRCTDQIVFGNHNDVKHWVVRLMGLEKVLALKVSPVEFFEKIDEWFGSVSNLRADLIMMALEYYLMITGFLNVVILSPDHLVTPVVQHLRWFADKLLENNTHFGAGPNLRIKGACILSECHYYRLFTLYMQTIQLENFVPTSKIKSNTQFAAIVLKNDYACFANIMNEYTFGNGSIVEINKMLTCDEDKAMLMVLHETRKSFKTSKITIEGTMSTIWWHVPDLLVRLPAECIEALFLCFSFVLLRFIGIPMNSSKLDMDVDGVECVDTNEYEVILNFAVQRYFALHQVKRKARFRTIIPLIQEDPDSPDHVIDD